MTRTKASALSALAVAATPTVPVVSDAAVVLPDADTPCRTRQQTVHYKPEAIKQKTRRKTRRKGMKVHIRVFYTVCIDDNTKPNTTAVTVCASPTSVS